MGVYKTHLVTESVHHSVDHVLNGGTDRAQARVVLAGSVPNDELHFTDWVLGEGGGDKDSHRHVDVRDILFIVVCHQLGQSEPGFPCCPRVLNSYLD